MKENNNGNDTNVGSIENSIEEAIERLEYIDRTYSCNNYYSIWDLKCIEILLSNYKRVLKENKQLRTEVNSSKKEYEKYKRLAEMNLKNAEEFKNNMCEHRCLLKSEKELGWID